MRKKIGFREKKNEYIRFKTIVKPILNGFKYN